uniref:Uncharacterized protein n=1 Tax=Amphimedon queenslandica TaxID=400682 RepID=A0A1X7UNS5_AMPQE
MFAVKDRVDLSNISDLPRNGFIDVSLLLQQSSDHDEMLTNLTTLISRILVDHFSPFLNKVPLGTVLKNKNKLDEMCQILDVVHKTSVPNDPKDNMKSTEDFFELVLVSHIIVAANTKYKQGMELEDLVDVTVKKYIKLSPQSAGQNTYDFVCTNAHESNIKPSSIARVARALSIVNEICQSFRDSLLWMMLQTFITSLHFQKI